MSGGSGSSPASTPSTPGALQSVTAFATREKLFRRVGKVLVAVSGGPDSVACLLLLLALRERFGFEVIAAHFDHKLREGSDEDLGWVRQLCATLEVKCLTGEGDVRARAAERRLGIEDAGRRMRYQFLAFAAGREGADCIATGHTADDQAETVLMRIVRGTGVRGLRGMLPASEAPGAPAQRLVRPLLPLGREDTAAVCREAGIAPRADPSNLDLSLGRNRIRHEALVSLRALNPSIDRALVGLGESARELFAPPDRAALGLQPVSRGPEGSVFPTYDLAALPNEAVTLVVEREAAFHGLDPEVNRTRVKNLRSVLDRGAGRVAFGGVVVEASVGWARIGPALTATGSVAPAVLNIPGATMTGGWRVEASTSPLTPTAGAAVACVDLKALKGALRVRSLAPGDRVSYHGLVRKVSDVFAIAKVPRWQREGVLALTDSSGIVALLGGPGGVGDAPPSEDALYVRATRVAAAS